MKSLMQRSLMPRFLLSIVFCSLLAIINTSCNEQEIFYRYHELKNADWHQKDTLFFEIDAALFELNIPYSVSIEVTNNVNYPYQNIWFFIQSNLENNSVYNSLSKEYVLADEFGKWKGSGFGSLYQISLPFYNNVVFKEKRNYIIKLEHGMRDEPLKGIERIGIRITKIK